MKKIDFITAFLLSSLVLGVAAGAFFVFINELHLHESWGSILLDFGIMLLVAASGLSLIICFQVALDKFRNLRANKSRR